MASITDVAKLARVGTTTVSRVVNGNGYVALETKERVLKAIKELNYSTNFLGKSLKQCKSNLVALFIPTVNHPFFSNISYCIEDELAKLGYHMLLVNSQGFPEKEKNVLGMISSGRVDGVIFITYYNHEIDASNLPVVTLDRHITGVPCITSDNYEATMKALNYLYDKGCRKIAFIGGKAATESETTKRFTAYNDFCLANNLAKISSYEEMLHGDETQIARDFLNKNKDIDALFCTSDLFAYASYRILKEQGRNVPVDVKIIGFDGVLNNMLPEPRITVVRQEIPAIAKALVNNLIKRINGEACSAYEYVKTEFILGETA